jgi:hypothetical protein
MDWLLALGSIPSELFNMLVVLRERNRRTKIRTGPSVVVQICTDLVNYIGRSEIIQWFLFKLLKSFGDATWLMNDSL